MEAKLQRRIQRYGWDKAAHIYEQSWLEPLAPAQNRLLEMANLRPGERVLDIACGTGLVTFPAASAVGMHGEVIGTDISDEMIRLADDFARKNEIHNVQFRQMDGEDLRFPKQSFDAVLCALGLLYFPNPLQSLREIFRVLKPGGRAVIAVWGHRDKCGWSEVFPIVDARVKSEVCPMFFQLGTGDMLQLQLENAGFSEIQNHRLSSELHFPTDERACSAAFVGGPVALAYARFDESTKADVHREYLDSIAEYHNGNSYRIPGEFVVAAGYKCD